MLSLQYYPFIFSERNIVCLFPIKREWSSQRQRSAIEQIRSIRCYPLLFSQRKMVSPLSKRRRMFISISRTNRTPTFFPKGNQFSLKRLLADSGGSCMTGDKKDTLPWTPKKTNGPRPSQPSPLPSRLSGGGLHRPAGRLLARLARHRAAAGHLAG